MKKDKEWIEMLTKEVVAGEIYDGTVTRLMDFGAFVEVLPGKEGLVHISEIAHERTNAVSDVLKVGDTVKVKVKEIDDQKRINLSMKALIDAPANMSAERSQDQRGSGGGGGKKFFGRKDKR